MLVKILRLELSLISLFPFFSLIGQKLSTFRRLDKQGLLESSGVADIPYR